MNLKKEEYYSAKDFIIGQTIIVFGRTCLVYTCDEFTQKWCRENLGVDQVPIDLQKEKPQKYWQQIPPYNGFGSEEDSLGSVFSLNPKPPRKDVNKMFTMDSYILRYEARLISENKDDNQRKFIVSFFCGDDTIQVYEQAERNSGLWAGKFLEKRQHKKPDTTQYYNAKDFRLGETLTLTNYRFQLLRADEFTNKYMKENVETFPEANIDFVLDKLFSYRKNFKNNEDFAVNLFKALDKSKKGFIEFVDLFDGLIALNIPLSIQEQYTLMRKFETNNDFKLSMDALYNGLFVCRRS